MQEPPLGSGVEVLSDASGTGLRTVVDGSLQEPTLEVGTLERGVAGLDDGFGSAQDGDVAPMKELLSEQRDFGSGDVVFDAFDSVTGAVDDEWILRQMANADLERARVLSRSSRWGA